MAKDQRLDDQIDSDEELLNFDLDDLSFSDDSAGGTGDEEEIIELVELVERGPSEDITRDLKVGDWSPAGGKGQQEEISLETAQDTAAEEDSDLDLSDISLEMGAEEGGKSARFTEDDISESDLEGLLEEEEDIALDLTAEGIDLDEKAGEEISEADLQALLSETDEQSLGEEAGEEASLEILADDEIEEMDVEPMEETQVLDFKPVMEDSLLVEEPEEILAKEVEELGAAADLVGGDAEPLDEEMLQEEEEIEAAAVPELAEETVEEESTEEEVVEEEALAGISEEKLEEIIRKVVGEVVERAARETMAEVAEKMIGEAIDALRQNLQSPEP